MATFRVPRNYDYPYNVYMWEYQVLTNLKTKLMQMWIKLEWSKVYFSIIWEACFSSGISNCNTCLIGLGIQTCKKKYFFTWPRFVPNKFTKKERVHYQTKCYFFLKHNSQNSDITYLSYFLKQWNCNCNRFFSSNTNLVAQSYFFAPLVNMFW